jgi:hypothetical protein
LLLNNPCCCDVEEENPDCVDTCGTCDIPKRNIPVSWIGHGSNPSDSGELVYKGFSTWECVYEITAHTFTFTDENGDPRIAYYGKWTMSCEGGQVLLQWTLWDSTLTHFSSAATNDTFGGCMITDSSTCDPFTMDLTMGSAVTLVCFTPGDVNRIDSVSIDGTGLSGGGCCQSFTVTGCNSLPIYQATVRVRSSSGGTILAEGVTDFAGAVSLAWDGGCSVWLEAEYSPEFTAYGASVTLTAGDVTTIAMASLVVTATYRCITGCSVPAPLTMFATHPVMGSLTFTWNGAISRWQSIKVYSYPGYGPGSCAAATVTVDSRWNGANDYREIFKVATLTDCPTDAGATTRTYIWGTSPAFRCPNSVVGWSWTFGTTPLSTYGQNLYQTTSAISISLLP